MPFARRTLIAAVLSTLAATPAAIPTGTTASPPPDPTVSVEVVTEADFAVDLAWRAGDPHHYVVEKGGRILQLDPATGATTPVLDIGGEVSGEGEQGLLGLAFAPDGTHAYINYTDNGGDTVVAELPVSPDGLAFDGDSARPLLTIEQPYANHNGGGVEFGPDGMLYVGTGDGGAGGDPERRALDAGDLLGKLLRIDPAPSGDLPYTVPPDNPFVGVDGARAEIWSVGLRNPWRFSFDPARGDVWIADVGQSAFEEIDVAAADAEGRNAGRGANFGWSAYEGDAEFNTDQLDLVDEHHAPIHAYDHGSGRCSVSGGAVVRGEQAGGLDGWYVFGDYCSGEVWGLLPDADLEGGRVVPLASVARVTAVIAPPTGEVFVLDTEGVKRLTPDQP